MDGRADWEDVNRIKGICTLMYVPNLSVLAYILMYYDGQRWMCIPEQLVMSLEYAPNDIARRKGRAMGSIGLMGLPFGG